MKEFDFPPRLEVSHPLDHYLGILFIAALEHFAHIEIYISPESQQNLQALDEHFRQGHSVIAAGYHSSVADGPLYTALTKAKLRHLNRSVGPIAVTWYDQLPYRLATYAASFLLRSHLLPIVRAKDIENNPANASRKEKLFNRLKTHTQRIFKHRGGMYAVAPQGERRDEVFTGSETGDINESFVDINYTYANGRLPYVLLALVKNETDPKKYELLVSPLILLSDFSQEMPLDQEINSQNQALWLMAKLDRLVKSAVVQPA